MRIALVHNEKKLHTGAHYINDLMVEKLRARGHEVQSIYPRAELIDKDSPIHLRGLQNILFFQALIEHRRKVLRCDLLQGTTYTPLPFLRSGKPVVCHFGSTTAGFLASVKRARNMLAKERDLFIELRKSKVIREIDIKTRRPMRDIAEIERYVAKRASAVIATSLKVRDELIEEGVEPSRIRVIHNAIEDYWLEPVLKSESSPSIYFLGRLGLSVFDLKLKGFDRLVRMFRAFPNVPKKTIAITGNKLLAPWMDSCIPSHVSHMNLAKERIPGTLVSGGVLLITSRYEGFSLSLIEGMSRGLVPVAFSVGVVPEVIENGVNGFVVNTVEEGIHAMKRLLSDDELRHRMAKAARKTAERFSADVLVDRLVPFYEETVAAVNSQKMAKKKAVR